VFKSASSLMLFLCFIVWILIFFLIIFASLLSRAIAEKKIAKETLQNIKNHYEQEQEEKYQD